MIAQDTLMNYVGGRWEAAVRDARRYPSATQRRVTLSPRRRSRGGRRRQSRAAAGDALPAWRRTPPGDRIQPLFRLKALLDAHFTRDRAADHPGMRQDARRVRRRAAGAASRTSRSPPASRR